MTIVLDTGDNWNWESNDNLDDGVQVVSGATMHYTANKTDTSDAYLKDSGGVVTIDAGVTLTSYSCTFNGTPIADNTTGAAYYIDTIQSGGSWIVDERDETETEVTNFKIETMRGRTFTTQTMKYGI